MFHIGKKSTGKIYAPLTGKVVSLNQVPDEVFSGKILGDGAAVIPENGMVVSPVNGTVVNVPDTFHAYYIHSDDGLDILVHVGIDTVKLKGEGFENFVKTGDKVSVGDTLVKVDVNALSKNGYNMITPVVISNMDIINDVNAAEGPARAGQDCMITYTKK